jgi:hypothetical protein
LRPHGWRQITPKLKGGKRATDDDAELNNYELRAELFLYAVQRRVAVIRAGDIGALPARDKRVYHDYHTVQFKTPPCDHGHRLRHSRCRHAGREMEMTFADRPHRSRGFDMELATCPAGDSNRV